MTQFSTIINAIILLPAGVAIDSIYARHCIAHIERRGYELVGVVHDWTTALTKVRAQEAEVVVFARRDHFDPDWTPRVEFVGQTSRDLRPELNTNNAGRNRDRRPRML